MKTGSLPCRIVTRVLGESNTTYKPYPVGQEGPDNKRDKKSKIPFLRENFV